MARASEYGPEHDAAVAQLRVALDAAERAELTRLRRQRRDVLLVSIEAADGKFGYHGLVPTTEVWRALGFADHPAMTLGQQARAQAAGGVERGAPAGEMILHPNSADGFERGQQGGTDDAQ